MAQSTTPRSYVMASYEMQQSLLRVKVAAKALLAQVLNLDNEGSEIEVRRLTQPAFQNALNRAFRDSKTIPVQPDYLIASTAACVWLLACERVGHDVTKPFPECPAPITFPPMFNGEVSPSPEHEALIREDRAAEAANTAARNTRESQAMNRQAAQVNVPVQAAQASSSAGRCVQPGQGDNASRGPAVPAPSPKSEHNSWSQNVAADDGAQIAIKHERHADIWQILPVRVNDAPYRDQAFFQDRRQNTTYVPRGVDAQGEVVSGETEQSSRIMSARADKMKAAMIAGATEPVPLKTSRNSAAPDPVKKYSFRVDTQATRFMQNLWDLEEFSSRYPTDAGYTCTGRPFEVKVHLSKARLFFGHKFCDREKVLDAMRSFYPVRVYAHWEGDFAVIGLTTQEGKKWTDPSDRINYFGFLRSLTAAMNQLACWSRALQRGEITSFARHMEHWLCHEIYHHGVPVDAAYNGKGKEVASADGTEMDVDSGAADTEALAEGAEASRKRRRLY